LGATERIVKHLSLRADREADVRRALLTVEDALRCASLPDAGARLLLVRHLNLGIIAQGVSSQTLSRLIEEKVAAVGGVWVHAINPTAEYANFVFFRDSLEARHELALRLARTRPCTAWYWRLAVPEFKLAEGTHANLRSIALAIAALPEAPAALPAWIARLTAAGVASVIARAIGSTEAAVLLHSAHLYDTHGAQEFQSTLKEQPQFLFARQHGYLAELPLQTEHRPALATLPSWLQVLSRARGFLPFTESGKRVATESCEKNLHGLPIPRHVKADATPVPAQLDNIASEAALEISANTLAIDVHRASLSEQFNADEVCMPDQPHGNTHEAAKGPVLNASPFLDASPTAYGGLLFLLPVLQRLDYPAWAEVLPEVAAAHIVQQMLALVLRHLDAPTDDPAWLLASSSLSDPFGHIDVIAPATWDDPMLVAPRGAAAKDLVTLVDQAQSAVALAHVLLIASRRWLRRIAGIGVASLVRRPAAIGLRATHGDVFFRLGDADMRIRRAGLDFDPGWVPWYGRVISFHYTEQYTLVSNLRAHGVSDGG
jgi:hypothetical protein